MLAHKIIAKNTAHGFIVCTSFFGRRPMACSQVAYLLCSQLGNMSAPPPPCLHVAAHGLTPRLFDVLDCYVLLTRLKPCLLGSLRALGTAPSNHQVVV